MLAQGANVNSRDSDQDTPLICAAFGVHLGIINLLLANNADVNAQNGKGYTALVAAATKGIEALPIVELLLTSGASPNLGPTHGDAAGTTPLYFAAIHGNNAVIKYLLSNGASINASLANDGTTTMHCAAAECDYGTVKLLYDKGAPLDIPRNDGNTPLQIAIKVGNLDAAKALLDLGASIEGLDGEGATPLLAPVD